MRNAHLERARVWLSQSRPDLAAKELRLAIGVEPESGEAHALLALCLVDLGRAKEALQNAERAVGLEPAETVPHLARAHALLALGKPRHAEEAAAQALALDPELPHAHGVVARARFAQKRFADALAAAEAGLEQDPEDHECLNMRALALVQLGRAEEADLALGPALARDPEDPQTHMGLGWSALHRRDAAGAILHYREALRLEPGSDAARAGLVEALKSRNVAYRLLLALFLWMTRIRGRTAMLLMVGTVVLRGLISSWAETLPPALAVVAWSLFWAIAGFMLATWLAPPLFNTLLRLDRDGRHALSPSQRLQSSCLLAMLLATAACAALAWADLPAALVATAMVGVLTLPVVGTTGARGRTRLVLAVATLGLAAVGGTAVVQQSVLERFDLDVQAAKVLGAQARNPTTRTSGGAAGSFAKQRELERLAALLPEMERRKATRDTCVKVFTYGVVAFTWVSAGASMAR